MISRIKRLALVLVLGLLAPATFPAAEEGPKPAKPKDQQVVSSKAVKRASAKAVNFRKAYTLPFPSLITVGSRIEAARRASDPVALAHAANELAVAEKVSGKKASLTSSVLLQESAQLAKLRRQAAELIAVQTVANQVAGEERLVTQLKEDIAAAKAATKRERDAILSNEEPTSAPRRVIINNYTTQYMDVYANGFYKIQVLPGSSGWFVIEQKFNPTVLTAYGDEDTDNWGPRSIYGELKTYTWNMND